MGGGLNDDQLTTVIESVDNVSAFAVVFLYVIASG